MSDPNLYIPLVSCISSLPYMSKRKTIVFLSHSVHALDEHVTNCLQFLDCYFLLWFISESYCHYCDDSSLLCSPLFLVLAIQWCTWASMWHAISPVSSRYAPKKQCRPTMTSTCTSCNNPYLLAYTSTLSVHPRPEKVRKQQSSVVESLVAFAKSSFNMYSIQDITLYCRHYTAFHYIRLWTVSVNLPKKDLWLQNCEIWFDLGEALLMIDNSFFNIYKVCGW